MLKAMAETDNNNWLLAILLMAVFVRLVVVFVFFGNYQPIQDASEWSQAAQNFLNGKGLIVNNNLKAVRTPVPGFYFAAMYSLFGISVRPIQIANVFLGVLTVWLAYDLVRRSFGVMPAFWAGIFVSFYPLFLLYTGMMLSETPVVMLIALGLWLVWTVRDRAAMWFAPIGIVLGLATLTRETVLPIAFLLAVWSFAVRRHEPWHSRCLPALVMLSLLVLTVTPWAMRNYFLLDRFVPLTSRGGESLWEANNPQADGSGVGGKFSKPPQIEALPEVDRGIAYQQLAVRFIAEDPLRFAGLTLRRLLYFWHLGYHGEGLTEIIFLLVYLPMLGLAAVGAWRGWRSNPDGVLLLLTVPVSLTIVHAVFLPVGRYRLPADLVVCILAGAGAAWAFSELIGRLPSRKFAPVKGANYLLSRRQRQ
jgi:4-amino-4-deoxy-L-arabinose transferase-like glycosyltransferase